VGGGAAGTIESCFAGLRSLVGGSQNVTRQSAAEGVRLPQAIETANRLGTTGTSAWAAVRLGIEIDGQLICLDEAALAGAYTVTHHNCDDRLAAVHGERRYELTTPNLAPARSPPRLTVFTGTTMTRGPIDLSEVSCMGNSPSGLCGVGGTLCLIAI
jgi:hypothetical protein